MANAFRGAIQKGTYKKMKSLSFLILLLTIPSQSFAQGVRLTGKIVDEKNGTPLIYATISIKGKGIGTISNTDGEFEFHISQKVI
jgi:hypothetical protein